MKNYWKRTSVILTLAGIFGLILILEYTVPIQANSNLTFVFHQSIGSDSTRDLALADLDGDGDLDAFAANSEGNCLGDFDTYWLNDGTGTFTLGGDLGLRLDSHAVSLGDLNGDGDTDAVIGIDFGPPANLVYMNDGYANFTLVQSLGESQTYDLDLGDLDGDADLDIFFANWYGANDEIWVNDGSGNFVKSAQPLSGNYSISVKLGDLNGNDDLDILIGKWAEDEIWFNNGSGIFSKSDQIIAAERSEDVALGDLDNDGDLDAVIVYQFADTEIYFNDGDGNFTNSGQALYMRGTRGVALGDLDQDGDIDAVFVNDYGYDNTAWVNDGSGHFTNTGIYLGLYTASQDVEMGDLDGDGDLDLMIANYTNDQANHVWINETIPDNQSPSVETGGPYSVYEGYDVLLSAVGSDLDEDLLEYAWDLDDDGIFETPGQDVTFSADFIDGPIVLMVSVQVRDEGGLTATDGAQIDVLNNDPVIGSINGSIYPIQIGTIAEFSAPFSDTGRDDTHTATWDWGDGMTTDGIVNEAGGEGMVRGSHAYAEPGVYEVALTLLDDDSGSDEAIFQYVVVFDPTAGFVTGGGSIYAETGSYQPDTELEGEAKFGFVSKYQKVTTLPIGHTDFQFGIGDLRFESESYDWLIVNRNDSNAQFKGFGTINGEFSPNGEHYRFMIWATDNNPDTFRIKIWWLDADTEVLVFDNGSDQPILNGNISIHTK